MGVVISVVASHFISDEIGLLIGLVSRLQFYLGNDQTIIIAVKLVDFERMSTTVNKIAGLVDDARLTQLHQLHSLILVDGFLKLITTQASVDGRPFDSEESLVITNAHPDRMAMAAADVSLTYMAATAGLKFV